MAYKALYRQYRPQFFKDVVGQKIIVKTLQNACNNNLLGHAYLFVGPRGTGKTSIAKILARTANCQKFPIKDACGMCEFCQVYQKGETLDIIEIDAASNNGVDEIRDLREKTKYMPSLGRVKVYIIDEVHMLTPNAFNALLKTLEEPPKHVIFILATTEFHKVPATIVSRTQRFDFKNIEISDISDRLRMICNEQKIAISDESLDIIAINSEGGLRDAISLLDQIISYAGNDVSINDVYEISGSLPGEKLNNLILSVYHKDSAKAFLIVDDLIKNGKDIGRIIHDLVIFIKDALLIKDNIICKKQFSKEIITIPHQTLFFYIDLLNELQNNIRFTHQKRTFLEIYLVKMCNHKIIDFIDNSIDIANLKEKIAALEKDKLNFSNQNKTEHNKYVPEPLFTILDIQAVLSNNQREQKNKLQKGFDNLSKYPEGPLKATANLLAKSKLIAINNDYLLIAFKDLAECKTALKNPIKENILKIINNKQKFTNDLFAIKLSDYQIIEDIYKNEYDPIKNPFPKLPNIDFKIYKSPQKTNEQLSAYDIVSKEIDPSLIEIEE